MSVFAPKLPTYLFGKRKRLGDEWERATAFGDMPQAGASSLNDAGQVAYTATTPTGERARFFDGTAVRDISPETGRAIALNPSGMVTGFVVRGSPHIFTWRPGPPEVLSVIDTSPSGLSHQ